MLTNFEPASRFVETTPVDCLSVHTGYAKNGISTFVLIGKTLEKSPEKHAPDESVALMEVAYVVCATSPFAAYAPVHVLTGLTQAS